MGKVSILIPARREVFALANGQTTLSRTVEEVYAKARGEFEVLVAFDGKPYEDLRERKNLRVWRYPVARGTKVVLNELVGHATGEYVMKLDAHCALSEGFDVELAQSCQDTWLLTPRFYTLNTDTWSPRDAKHTDYFLLPCPLTDPKLYRFQAGGYWPERTRERAAYEIDENLKTHGSSFFLRKSFYERMGGCDETHPDSASGEDAELSLKTWLGPWEGRVMVNKRVWVSHMHKGKSHPRSYHASQRSIDASYLYTANYWMRNRWSKRRYNIAWVIRRFAPVPTWPDDWEERQVVYEKEHPWTR